MAYDVTVRIKSFIPDAKVKDPWGDWYEGDDRSFDYYLGGRTRQDFKIDFAAKSIEQNTRVGETCRVNPGEPKVCDTASDSGFDYYDVVWKSDRVEFTAECSIGNPLSTGAPAIDYIINVTVYKNGKVCVYGNHDGFPNYEVWKKVRGDEPVPVYTYDHGSQGLGSLFPPMEEYISLRCA